MGGNAFSSRHLYTPRMPSGVYHQVKTKAHAQLRILYDRVETPIEGPAKSDHGDVDMIVLPRENSSLPTVDEIAGVLGAVEAFKDPGDNATTMYFAVNWPDNGEEGLKAIEDDGDDGLRGGVRECQSSGRTLEIDASVADNDDDNGHRAASAAELKDTSSTSTSTGQKRYIQIDVHVCPTVSNFQYTLFTNAHSDLRSIIGMIIRPFGLVMSTPGLCIIIPELESQNRSLSRVAITEEPDQILEYLGLQPAERYWTLFPDWNSAMDYATTCRFWNPENIGRPLKKSSAAGATPETSSKEPAMKVKAHDRGKANVRPMLRYWFDVYLPSKSRPPSPLPSHDHLNDSTSSPSLQPSTSSHPTHPPTKPAYKFSREEVLDDAIKIFGPTFQTRYETQKRRGLSQIRTGEVWSSIRKSLPCKGSDLTYTLKGLRYELEHQREHEGEGEHEKEEQSEFARLYHDQSHEVDGLLDWVGENWEAVRDRQVERDRVQSREKLLLHLERERVRGS